MNSKYKVGDKTWYIDEIYNSLIYVEILNYEEHGNYSIRVLSTGFVYHIHESNLVDYAKLSSISLQCECGKDKHGFASHTHWCQIKE